MPTTKNWRRLKIPLSINPLQQWTDTCKTSPEGSTSGWACGGKWKRVILLHLIKGPIGVEDTATQRGFRCLPGNVVQYTSTIQPSLLSNAWRSNETLEGSQTYAWRHLSYPMKRLWIHEGVLAHPINIEDVRSMLINDKVTTCKYTHWLQLQTPASRLWVCLYCIYR